MKPAAKRVGVAQLHRDDLHAQLVELLGLPDLRGFHAHRLRVEDEHVHVQPDAAEHHVALAFEHRLGGLDDLPIVLLEEFKHVGR